MSWGVALRNAVGLGLGGIPSLRNAPSLRAALDFNFLSGLLDPRITFSRTSNATLIGSDGTLQYAPHNLLTYSEQFDNAAWTKGDTTVTANAITAPDGTQTADKLVENTATAFHVIALYAGSFTPGMVGSISCYLKAAERSVVRLQTDAVSGFGYADFNLLTGAITNINGICSSATATPVGNGWYRCSIVCTATGTSAFGLKIIIGTSSYTGDGTSGIYTWGAQLNVGALQPYYKTEASAYYGPRFDYDPVTLAAKGLLIEEQRTNSIRNNTMQGAVAGTPGTLPTNWSSSLAGGLSKEVVAIGQVNGISYIDLRIFGTTTNTNLALNLPFEPVAGVSSASGQAWAESIYLALVNGSLSGVTNARLYLSSTDGVSELAYFNLGDVTLTSALTRFSGTASPATAGMTAVRPMFWVQHNGTGTALDFTLRIGLPQLEQGAFATSVIPTTTAAATRAADVASMTGANFSSWYNQTEGTVFVEPTLTGSRTSDSTFFRIDDGTNNNRAQSGTGASFTVLNSFIIFGGVSQGTNVVSVSPTVASKSAFAFATNISVAAANGTVGTTDTTVTVPTGLNRLLLGRDDAVGYLNGHIRSFKYYQTRLSNNQLQSLTALPTPKLSHTLMQIGLTTQTSL